MAEYIGKYENAAAIQSAVDGGELVKPYVALDENTGMIDWNSKLLPKETPLTFNVTGSGNIVWKASSTAYTVTLEYKLNDGEWTEITSTTTGVTIPVVSGDTIQFRGNNAAYGNENSYYNTFQGTTAQFKVKGNIMSLINSTDYSSLTTLSSGYTFFNLFYNITGLTDASNLILPARKLTPYCYRSMFRDCTSLTQAPELPVPSDNIVFGGYQQMFYGCTSLTTAPDLLAPAATSYQYKEMFQGCSSLNYIKCFAAGRGTTGNNNAFTNWVNGVASTGTFVKKAGVNWYSGISGIPSGWTVIEE